MECAKCGYDYPAKDVKCPYCGEPNPLGIAWKQEEEEKTTEMNLTKKKILHSMPLYITNKIFNVILLMAMLLVIIFLLIAFVFGGVESVVRAHRQSQASVEEAEALLAANDNEALQTYLKQYDVSGTEEYEKYFERVLLYGKYAEFIQAAFNVQQVLDWGKGEQPASFSTKYLLETGHEILEADTYWFYDLEYEENRQFLEEMQQQVSAVLMGIFEMTEEEIHTFAETSCHSEEYDELKKMIIERRGWEYEE
ncbi:MAG: zinc ribbon domain-containing protein [Roseburia sp.]